ncbi:MAG: UDP-N-acetylmuramoyl-L-alanyl-D-glutamate--2,6-diaminopimelate ligase [Patescibacteria group bacterium]
MQALKNYYHLLQALIAISRLGHPAHKMVVIGVTGTDGKTTTSSLIYHILQETGHKAALISTVAVYIGNEQYDTGFHVSTPGSAQLQSYILKAAKEGITHLVLEVTSHALDQHRVYGIPFKVGVLTNITREHLDYHKTMDAYTKAKVKLLLASSTVILNRDDASFAKVSPLLKQKKLITYGLTDIAEVTPQNHHFTTHLTGHFNTSNILAALAVCDALGIDPAKSARAVTTFQLPEGRFDIVYDKDFRIIIDFAHTPNALKNILKTVKSETKKGKIIHVFGSAGQRDAGKRPLMGQLSAQFADTIVLTSEDPRSESAESIAQEIIAGMPKNSINVEVITDRQTAITHAVIQAKEGDTILITGKGHEKSMNMGQGEVQWSDHEAVLTALQIRNSNIETRNKSK